MLKRFIKIDELSDNVKSLIEIVVIAAVVLVMFIYVIIPVRIKGSSMENTLNEGNIAFINAIGSHNGNVDRFDVVVLNCEQLDERIIKRVIGLPGDHIVYKDDQLFINGEYVEETFLDKKFIEDSKEKYGVSFFTYDFEVTVGEDEIFAMGDNRLRSTDSRELGCFTFDDVIGKEGIVIFPLDEIQWLD